MSMHHAEQALESARAALADIEATRAKHLARRREIAEAKKPLAPDAVKPGDARKRFAELRAEDEALAIVVSNVDADIAKANEAIRTAEAGVRRAQDIEAAHATLARLKTMREACAEFDAAVAVFVDAVDKLGMTARQCGFDWKRTGGAMAQWLNANLFLLDYRHSPRTNWNLAATVVPPSQRKPVADAFGSTLDRAEAEARAIIDGAHNKRAA